MVRVNEPVMADSARRWWTLMSVSFGNIAMDLCAKKIVDIAVGYLRLKTIHLGRNLAPILRRSSLAHQAHAELP
jgi:hypothetical protein